MREEGEEILKKEEEEAEGENPSIHADYPRTQELHQDDLAISNQFHFHFSFNLSPYFPPPPSNPSIPFMID
jgi:hypothetical protein